MEVKDFSQDPGPHNPTKTMIEYLWFGAGSVPWKGQGKYPLGQLLFLLSGVIITHQLDILYKMCDVLSWYPTPVLYLPKVLILCTLATISLVGMVSIHTGTKGGSVVNRYYKGLSYEWAQLSHEYEKPEDNLSGCVLIPLKAYLGSTIGASRTVTMGYNRRSHLNWNRYVSMKELIPKVDKLGYCTQRTMTRMTCPPGIT